MESVRGAMSRLPKTPGLRPEHIVATGTLQARAQLIDPWGRPFPLRHKTRIGRNPGDVDIAVLDNAVSMVHAEIYWEDNRWWVNDLGSTNGTFVDGRRIEAPVALERDQVVTFGDVGFVFMPR